MSIYIHNSLTRKKEEFIPIRSPKINIYSCGVTVYDDCHIGHARSLYIFDLIRRYLKYRGFDVNFVRNITDIDDKIINRANELKTDWKELVKKYIDRYYEDLASLGIDKADIEPRATENIQDMIKHIQALIDKDYAYETDTGVYFKVRRFKDYGKLSGQGIEQILSGVRKEADETKTDALDFALWKKSKPQEPFWPSPWGDGRPGWHIECSVMSSKYLKTETLDIHAGGLDLIFPHHENEIAQAEALTGKQFARYWIHHGLLTINSQKMAKSLGNFVTIKDFLNKYGDSDILKLFFLSTHYSHPIDYNSGKIQEAGKQKKIFHEFFDRVNNWDMAALEPKDSSSAKDTEKIEVICQKFEKAMDDDFNTPQALGYLFELVDLGSKFVSQDKKEAFIGIHKKAKEFLGILGIKEKSKTVLPEELLSKVKERAQARKNKDFKKADELRQDIKDKFGYFVEDTAGTSSCTAI